MRGTIISYPLFAPDYPSRDRGEPTIVAEIAEAKEAIAAVRRKFAELLPGVSPDVFDDVVVSDAVTIPL